MLLFTFLMNLAFAQDSPIKNRWTIKAYESKYRLGQRAASRLNEYSYTSDFHHTLELNYGISKNIELGIYSGFSSKSYGKAISMGIQTNYHILPLFIKAKDFRFDAYLSGRLGTYWYKSIYINSPPETSYSLEYSLGAGAAFYPLKHLGVFCEYHWGDFSSNLNQYYKLGLIYKFRKRK